jgi:hypothetical protein
MTSKQGLAAWAPWWILLALGPLWGLTIFYEDQWRVCGLHSPFPAWMCISMTIGMLVIPLLMAGTLGFILGRRFGKRETTGRAEYEFD